MKVGDVLPKEGDLSKNLNVSRHIVREGLSRLKALGLVKTRKKSGSTICKPDLLAGFRKIIETGIYNKRDYWEFWELRIALELGMCNFIFAHRTAKKITALRKVAEKKNVFIQKHQNEIDFHSTLMSMGHNEKLVNFLDVLQVTFFSFFGDYRMCENSVPTHLQICNILENGTFEEFRDAMLKHFDSYRTVAS